MELTWWTQEDYADYGALWPWFLRDSAVTAGHVCGVKPPRGCDVLWTSPVDTEDGWYEWCESDSYEEGIRGRQHWQLTLNDSARLLVIESVWQLPEIVQRFPCTGCELCLYDARQRAEQQAAGRGAMSLVPFPVDWPALVVEYDGIHLTAEGQWSTRLPDPFEHKYHLYGWDCETVLLWNRDLVSNPRRLL